MGCISAPEAEPEQPKLHATYNKSPNSPLAAGANRPVTLENLMARNAASQKRVDEMIQDDDDHHHHRPQGDNNQSDNNNLNPAEFEHDEFVAKGDEGEMINGCTYGSFSRRGYLPYAKYKVNQDRFLIIPQLLKNDPGISVFAVMDGHGEFGHLVADYVRNNLGRFLAQQEDLRYDPFVAITTAVKNLVDDLTTMNNKNPQTAINLSFSGTTVMLCVMIDNKLYVGNVGDSRSVMCKQMDEEDKDDIEATTLSIEHKPEKPEEAARIKKYGGRIEQLDRQGPLRVWLAEVNSPGLTVTRAIGDEVAQTVGVLSIPQIVKHEIDTKDRFVIFATDGVWQFITNEEAIELVWPLIDKPKVAAQELVNEARRRWESKEDLADDLTCVILNLNQS